MTYTYCPKGVCSRKMTFEVEDGRLHNLVVEGGCHGNLQGIGALVEGMETEEVIRRLEGIRCGMKKSSCPDQLAQALKELKAE